MRLLALDVGNTNITIGVFIGGRLARETRVETRLLRAQLGRKLLSVVGESLPVAAAVYGSVVPSINDRVEGTIQRLFGCRPLAVTPRSRLGIKLRVREPEQVGADRLFNALAAHERARGPAVVVDFGTATTFDCVSRRGDYLGGAILPGPRMAARALAQGTERLPLVEVHKPRRAIGKDTRECIAAGLYFGYLGMIEKVLSLTLREMRGEGPGIALFATGGLAWLFQRDLPAGMRLKPDMTLQGLRLAFERLTC